MICVVIKGPTFQNAYQQISAALAYADFVELRLDHFTSLDLTALKDLRSHFSLPMIFTLRSQQQGGNYKGTEEERLADLRRLAELKPEYLDLEYDLPKKFVDEVSSQHPEIKVILSYHHFTTVPDDLEAIYQEMRKIPAFYYKIAVTALNSVDVLRLLYRMKNSDGKLIAIGLGSYGQFSRILSKIVGCPITYASLDDDQKTAPGQLSAQTLVEQYHYRSMNPRTTIYGLIGDPVTHSIGDITHNELMGKCGIDGVYMKIQVKPSELADFFQLAKLLSFRGLSVTMPLKEHVIKFLDEIDPQAEKIGAVNTLVFENDKLTGYNTDGMGALNALENEAKVDGKRIVIIGAGGATKAIAYEAGRRGALVTILNRDEEKALHLSQKLQCESGGLDRMTKMAKAGYDILINCTPVSVPSVIDHFLIKSMIMDITTRPKDTEFLKHAKEKNCPIVYGYQMFVEQALGQFCLWFKDRIDIPQSREILRNKALECLS